MNRSPEPCLAALLVSRSAKLIPILLAALLLVSSTAASSRAASEGARGSDSSRQLVLPSLSIDDVKHDEGNSGKTPYVFTVLLSSLTAQEVTIDFTTTDGQATVANNDYQPTSGTLTIPANTQSGAITVSVNGDVKKEGTEGFTVELSNAVNASINVGVGLGIINDDDPVPSLSINDVTMAEGDSGGPTLFSFTVSLSNPTDQPVTVNFGTADGTATVANGDYTSTTGTLTIPAKAS